MENIAGSKKLRLRVLTPLRVVYDNPVDMLIARTTDGDIGILHGHENCTALLGDGALRVIPDRREQKEETLMVFGGILTVQADSAEVTSEMAEYQDRLQDYLDRLAAEKEANKRNEKLADLHANRLEKAIRQALGRL